MFKNYFKVAVRNLWNHKSFSAINIVGLAVGLGSFLLIALYVLDELSFDRFNEKASRIYRINSDIKFGGENLHLPVTSDMMGALLKKDYPEVENYTRIYASSGSKLIKKGENFINEAHVVHVDSTFFDVFTFPAIKGDTKTALNNPGTVVITASAANKYFGTVDALGKTVETNDANNPLYKVTAVIQDMPQNSHFHFDFLFSMKNVDYQWGQITSHNFHTYLLLKKGADPMALENKFGQYINNYVLPAAKQYMHINSIEEFEKAGNSIKYSLTPLTRLHLYSDRSFELGPTGTIQYVYIFSAVALFVLVIACINFMNLTTARSAGRAREVGIRKVLGTERKNLIVQFLTESTLIVLVALLLAIVIAWLALPLFNGLAGKSMTLSSLFSPLILPLLVVLPIVVGILAGAYPAFFLSAFRPIAVLKGNLRAEGNITLRSVLVVFQFATSIILIVGTIVIYRQLNFIRTKDLGYNKEQVLIIDNAQALKGHIESFKNEVLQMPGVSSGTISSFLPVSSSSRNDNSYSREAVGDSKSSFGMQSWSVDYDYFKTLGINLKQGRLFSREFGTDSTGVVINEETAKILGYADPLGKKIYTIGATPAKSYTVIGVVKNFNFESMHQPVGPLAFFLGNSPGMVTVKVSPSNVQEVLPKIESKWKVMAPAMPFSYRFLDDSFDEMYRADQRVGKTALLFSVLAILIACLGLFGLASFVAEKRTKEIGIRKVLGATVNNIVQLLSKDFVRLVAISFIIGAPVSWFFMHRWLQDFAYRTSINWWIFLAAGAIALAIALGTISFQAIRVAISNPVKSLRTE